MKTDRLLKTTTVALVVVFGILLTIFIYASEREPEPTPIEIPSSCISPGPSIDDSYNSYYVRRNSYCRDAVILSLVFAHGFLEIEHPGTEPWSEELASRWLLALNDIPGWWGGDPALSKLDFMTAALYGYAVATEDRNLFLQLDMVCQVTDPDFCIVTIP